MKKTMIRLAVLLMVFVLVLGLAACGGGGGGAQPSSGGSPGASVSPGSPAAGGEASPGGAPAKPVEITVAFGLLPNSFEPISDDSNTSISVIYHVFDHLVEFDNSDTTVWKPRVAKSWKQIDAVTWEFEIRDDVLFSNGDKLTMEDVEFSLMRLKDIAKSAPVGALIDSVSSSGYTLTLKITEPNNTAVQQILWTAVVANKAYLESGGDDALYLKPVATGPYRVVSFTPGAEAVLEAWDGYYGGKPQIDKITFTAIAENASRYIAVETGHVQYAGLVSAFEMQLAEDAGTFNTITGRSNRCTVFRLNTESPVFQDVSVRRGMAYALDRDSVAALNGGRPPAKSYLFATYEDLYYESPDMPDYDLDKARELFTAAGITPSSPVQVTLIHYQNDPCIEYYQSTLKQLGMEVNVNFVEFTVFQAAEKSGEFDIMWGGSRNFGGAPLCDLERFDSKFTGTRNISRYNNPEMDALIDKARITDDFAELKKLTDQINDIAARDIPDVPIYQQPIFSVMDKNLSGVLLRGDQLQNFRYAVYTG